MRRETGSAAHSSFVLLQHLHLLVDLALPVCCGGGVGMAPMLMLMRGVTSPAVTALS